MDKIVCSGKTSAIRTRIFPRNLCKRQNPEVRLNVLRCHPEYTLELLKDPDLVTKVEDYLVKQREASPPKFCLDGASIVRFCGFSIVLMIDFLLSP